MLASGACSCRAATPALLLTVNDRFKLQPLAKYMYSLERQSTTFLPPLSMTPANPYDFPQKSLAQESPTGVCSPKLCSLSGPWRVTSTLTPWTDLGVNAIRPGLPSEWLLLRRGMQWYTLDLQCWMTRFNAWLYTVGKRDTSRSSLACSPDTILECTHCVYAGLRTGLPPSCHADVRLHPSFLSCPMSAKLGTQCAV